MVYNFQAINNSKDSYRSPPEMLQSKSSVYRPNLFFNIHKLVKVNTLTHTAYTYSNFIQSIPL